MAVNCIASSEPASAAPGDISLSLALHNDAFSFWKLPAHWRAGLEGLTRESREVSERYLLEKYLSDQERQPPSRMDAYYRVKGLIPVAIRHRLNAVAVKTRRKRDLPRWPCESAMVEYLREWLHRSLDALGLSDGWHIAFWPEKKDCCVVLTHDVETPLGLKRMGRLADLEEKHGFRSAWNLPLAQYPIDWRLVEKLRGRGFEFGAHGLSHDGRMFRTHEDFAKLRPVVESLAREHGLRGFRGPSTLRRAEWIAAMEFDYDSTFADTDPYEPQPGGTCSVFPFFLSRVVELPYTLPQDHTLIHLLHRSPLTLWTLKARWIASVGGMILALTHPDYIGVEPYLSAYEQLLRRLAALDSTWRALPSEVAAWWRRRSAMKLVVEGDPPRIVGRDTSGAVARRVSEERLIR